jgi:glycosyltransferase involved in cell wall biosynthesis
MSDAVIELQRPQRAERNKRADRAAVTTDGVSVVICTYNGSRVIRLALQALAEQSFAGDAEIVLVDNNSTDGVAELAEQFWAKLDDPPFPLRRVREAKPGLAFARRAGVNAAKYATITFCDDDNLLASDYLERAVELLRDPSVGAVGGACIPISECELPPFFYTYAFHYAVGSPEIDSGPVDNGRGWLFGAGLTARRNDLLVIYGSKAFPTLTGRLGSAPGASGDDLELCFSLRLLGYRLLYDDKLRFKHYIEARKLKKEYIQTLRQGNKGEVATLSLYQPLFELSKSRHLTDLARRLVRWVRSDLGGTGDRRAAFWVLSFLGATSLMSQSEARIFTHYRHLASHRRPHTG